MPRKGFPSLLEHGLLFYVVAPTPPPPTPSIDYLGCGLEPRVLECLAGMHQLKHSTLSKITQLIVAPPPRTLSGVACIQHD